MHREDGMTSNERLTAFFEGKEVDHLPVMPFLDSIGCKVAGMSHREKRSSAKNTAQAYQGRIRLIWQNQVVIS